MCGPTQLERRARAFGGVEFLPSDSELAWAAPQGSTSEAAPASRPSPDADLLGCASSAHHKHNWTFDAP